jgi:Mg-chelatase subunit ChlD
MGFLEYVYTISFEKDPLKLKFILVDKKVITRLKKNEYGFTIQLPLPKFNDTTISFVGYEFPKSPIIKQQILRLFRATVFHLSGHSTLTNYTNYSKWMIGKKPQLRDFIVSLLEDINLNSHIANYYPKKLIDLSFASGLMMSILREVENIRVPATRLMASLMIYANTGLDTYVSSKDIDILRPIFRNLEEYKEHIKESYKKEREPLDLESLEYADEIYKTIKEHAPIIEIPSMPYTENFGPCTIFKSKVISPFHNEEDLQKKCYLGLGGANSEKKISFYSENFQSEALEVFDSYINELEKDQKIKDKYKQLSSTLHFKSIELPGKDLTEYLRTKARCKRSVSKMTEILTSILNLYTEDVQKRYGVLDLADAVQVIASKSNRQNIFLRDELIQQSFAWAIVIDASKSMKNVSVHARDQAVVLSEAASKVLLDANSWGIFAFNDSFEIVKDFSEQYNNRVKARLGGLEFTGLSLLPDALDVAGQALAKRQEELKVMIAISDGWPYGYKNIQQSVSDVVAQLEGTNIAVIGIGTQTDRMRVFFNSSIASYDLKQFVNLFRTQISEVYETIM